MPTVTELEYLKRAEDFFKAFNSGADLKASVANYNNFLDGGKTTDAVGAGLAALKIALSIASSVQNLPGFANLPFLDVASLQNNYNILLTTQNADGHPMLISRVFSAIYPT